MKKLKLAIVTIAFACSASANAMPAQVPETYYEHLQHRWDALTGAPGFCQSHIGAFAPICWVL